MGHGNNDAKTKPIFQHFWRGLKEMTKQKWDKLMNNNHTYALGAFRDKAQQFIWEIFGKDTCKEQHQAAVSL